MSALELHTDAHPQGKVFFFGDVHLGARVHANPEAIERQLVAFLESIASEASVICIMGDLFDYWFEFRHVVPKGYVRLLGTFCHLVAHSVEIHIVVGNHDVWIRDYLEKEIGVHVHHDAWEAEWYGKRFRMAHGDKECRDESPWTRFLYHLFRNPICQRLYSWVHPDLTTGFALRCSLKSRKKHLNRPYQTCPYDRFENPEQELLFQKSKQYLEQNPHIDYFVYGHRHLLLEHSLSEKSSIVVTGEWIQHSSYVVWDGKEIQLHPYFTP